MALALNNLKSVDMPLNKESNPIHSNTHSQYIQSEVKNEIWYRKIHYTRNESSQRHLKDRMELPNQKNI